MISLDATFRIYLQYYEKEINLTRISEKAYLDGGTRMGEPVNDLEVYVKPEDGRAYYVMNGRYEHYVNLWDSDTDICSSSELSGQITSNSEIQRRLIFEYRGKQCDCDNIIERIREKFINTYPDDVIGEMEIYVRQEHETAYYVINRKYMGSVSMFA